MKALLAADLSNAQTGLLEVLATAWSKDGKWPQWGYVQHHFERLHPRDHDAETVLRSLPRASGNPGYGLTTAPGHHPIDETDRIRLTIAAARPPELFRRNAGEPFLLVLQHMVELWNDRTVTPDSIGKAHLRSDQLPARLNLPGPFITGLPDLLAHEPGITTGNNNSTAPDGNWKREITRSVTAYRGIDNLDDYIRRTCEIVKNKRKGITGATFTRSQVLGSGTQTTHIVQQAAPAPAERPPCLDDSLLTEVEQAARNTKWKVDKLLTLCRELNSSYAHSNPYACAALLRAILDHIPPSSATKTSNRSPPSTPSPSNAPTRHTPKDSPPSRTSPTMHCTARSAPASPSSP
ncbi:hypothetical protein [Streptomyces zaomyceticus]|uniref:hypothetical protein n=1 Tax=Streptomyces zaomyceticus TaxID=68286 RepID=UPI0034154642